MMGKDCGTHGVRRNAYGVFVRKPEGKKPLGKPRPKLDDNIKMSLTEFSCETVIWIKLAENRDKCQVVVKAEMNTRVPYNAGNFLTRQGRRNPWSCLGNFLYT
jgi:hypothetical protein